MSQVAQKNPEFNCQISTYQEGYSLEETMKRWSFPGISCHFLDG